MSERRFDLDAVRGLMLVLMTLTHLPTRWSDPFGQPFGYVSAAEGFVMLSAYMAGMVYAGRGLKEGLPAMRRAFLLRALKIYGCQAALLLFLFTFIAAFGLTVKNPDVRYLISYYLREPLTAFWSALLLVHNPPLLDILPLYIVFMLASPWVLGWGLSRGWGGVLALSTALWVLAQFDLGTWAYERLQDATGLPVPARETGSFEMWGWQFLWVLGLYMGAGAARGDPPPRFPPWLVAVALAYGLAAFVWRHVAGQIPTPDHAALNAAFDKWHLAPLRLINFFALLVLAMRFGPALMARLPRLRWLEVLGAASLPVFCTHLVLVLIALLVYGAANPERPLAVDAAIVAVSFAVLTGVATISGRIDAYAADFKARRAARRSTGRAARERRDAPRSPSSTTHSRLR